MIDKGKAIEILEAREREFKEYMKDKRNNSREKQDNWYYLQYFDECCAMCEHSEDDAYAMLGVEYQCKHCGKVDWNGWCKKFIMAKHLVKEDEGV